MLWSKVLHYSLACSYPRYYRCVIQEIYVCGKQLIDIIGLGSSLGLSG